MSPRVERVLYVLILGFWVLILYGDSPSLPLFFDDTIHFRWLDWHSFSGIWRTAEALGYYRPVIFTIWKIMNHVLGNYDPFWLHTLNLTGHFLNALLVFRLVGLILAGRGSRLTPLIAALLFAGYPFSYQAVPWVGALTHPMVTLLLLLALNLYWQYRAAPQSHPLLLLGAAVCAALAPLANEAGIVIAPLLVLQEAWGLKTGRLRRNAKAILAMLISPLSATALWFLTPKSIGEFRLANLESLLQSETYFLQGVMYPVSPFGKNLMAGLGTNDLTSIWVVSLIGFGFLLAIFWKSGGLDLLGISISWWGLSLVPAWLFRGFDYLVDAPRVLYLSSVGTALLWAVTIDQLTSILARWRVRTLAQAGLTAAILVFSLAFIRTRMELYHLGGRLIQDAVPLTQDLGPEQSVLIVNLASWLAPKESTYPLGHEGVTMAADYMGIKDILYINTGIDRPAREVVVEDLLQDPTWYYFAPHGPKVSREEVAQFLREGAVAFLTEFEPQGPYLETVGRVIAQREERTGAPIAILGDEIALLSASCGLREERLTVDLKWESLREDLGNYTIFVHLYDAQGHLVTNRDRPPLGSLFPFPLWEQGELVEDSRAFSVPSGLSSGPYEVRVGLYDPVTGERVTASGPLARPSDNSVKACVLSSLEGA